MLIPVGSSFPDAALERSLVDRFERVVEAFPDREVFPGIKSCTYSLLARNARKVASMISEAVGRGEAPIAIRLPPSPEACWSIIGVLMSGRPYLGLDPYRPAHEANYILRHSRAELIIGVSEEPFLLESNCPSVLACDIETASEKSPEPSSPDSLASVFYTSGTTGEPKGVLDAHRNILYNIRNYSRAIDITERDVHSVLHTCAFGASRLDLFGAMLNGAGMYLGDLNAQSFPDCIANMVRSCTSILHTTPTIFRAMFSGQSELLGELPVRIVHLGSEAVTLSDFELFRRNVRDNAEFLIRYGTTETGTVCMRKLEKCAVVEEESAIVGACVPGTEIVLVDAQGRRTFEVVGEIAVRSDYLALGYTRGSNPARPSFACLEDVGRVYRTGDLGERLPEGQWRLHGRVDRQVKLRGARLNLDELEAAIKSHHAVKDAALIVHTMEQDQDSSTLGACVVLHSKEDSRQTEWLRRWFRDRYGASAVPRIVTCVDELRRTEQGKIDRAWVHAELVAASAASVGSSAEGGIEQLWRIVLGFHLADIRETDVFFDIGGDSLGAVQMLGEVKNRFGRAPSLREFLSEPTIRGIKTYLESGK